MKRHATRLNPFRATTKQIQETTLQSELESMIAPSKSSSSKDTTPLQDIELDIERTPSSYFRRGSSHGIQEVLTEVENQAEKRIIDGFSEINFTLGVTNCFVITYMFAAFPQHLWIIYIFEALIFFPLKARFLIKSKPLNQILYFLDYCWVMNIAGLVALLVVFWGKDAVSEAVRKHVFLAAYGTSCGPLFGSTAVLPFISLIFHHLHSITSVFIHFYPPLLFYILRWNQDLVLQSWPDTFRLDHDISFFPNSTHSFMDTVFGNTMIAYLIWFVPYSAWIITVGMDLPRSSRKKKDKNGEPRKPIYDTVFHANHRNGNCVAMGKVFWGRSEEESKRQNAQNDFEMRDLIVYLVVHFLLAMTSVVVLAYPCYLSKYAHGTFLIILLVACTWRGAKRYTYYSTAMYSRIIRSKFNDQLLALGGEQEIIHEG